LRLDFTRNNTGIRNSLDCSTGSQSTISQCIGASGGVFILNASSSFDAATSDSWNVTSIDAAPNGAHITYGYDTVTFGLNDTIPSFPFDVWSDTTSANRSSLGLGRNSSVLSSLMGAGVIPSPEFGLYYGSRSMNNPSDGELVIGGYNSNRVNGTFANFSMATSYLDQPCPLQVLLKDVRVTTSNGSSSSLMVDGEARVPACINPVENGFQFTPAMYKVWAGLTQHPSNPPSDGSHNYTQQTYPLSSEPLMNELIIQLEGGYQVNIPHYELVSYERGNDAQGLYAVINSSRIQSAVTDNGGRFTFPILGGVFLSQNYLNVDYNRNVFGLAQAITLIPSNNTVTSTCSGGTHA
ncbi:acid protease, partial [Acephala macrosclerotiorum]